MGGDNDYTQVTQPSLSGDSLIPDSQGTPPVNDSLTEYDTALHEEQPLDDEDL